MKALKKLIFVFCFFIFFYKTAFTINLLASENFYPQNVWQSKTEGSASVVFQNYQAYKNNVLIKLINNVDKAYLSQNVYGLIENVDYKITVKLKNVVKNKNAEVEVSANLIDDFNNNIRSYSKTENSSLEIIELDFKPDITILGWTFVKIEVCIKNAENTDIKIETITLEPKNNSRNLSVRNMEETVSFGVTSFSLEDILNSKGTDYEKASWIFVDEDNDSSRVKRVIDSSNNEVDVFTQTELSKMRDFEVVYKAGGFALASSVFRGKWAEKKNLKYTALRWYTFAKKYGNVIKNIIIEENLNSFLMHSLTLDDYALYIATVYNAVKSANVDVNIIVPLNDAMAFITPSSILKDLFDKYGLAGHIDIIGSSIMLRDFIVDASGNYNYTSLIENPNYGIKSLEKIVKDRMLNKKIWIIECGVMSDLTLTDNTSHNNSVNIGGYMYDNISGERAAGLFAFYMTSAFIYGGVNKIFWYSYNSKNNDAVINMYSLSELHNGAKRGMYNSVSTLIENINESKILSKEKIANTISIKFLKNSLEWYLIANGVNSKEKYSITTLPTTLVMSINEMGKIKYLYFSGSRLNVETDRLNPFIIKLNTKQSRAIKILEDSYESEDYLFSVNGNASVEIKTGANTHTFQKYVEFNSFENSAKLSIEKLYSHASFLGEDSLQINIAFNPLKDFVKNNNSSIGIYCRYFTNGTLAFSEIFNINDYEINKWNTLSAIIPLEKNITSFYAGFYSENITGTFLIDDLIIYKNPSMKKPIIPEKVNIDLYGTKEGVCIVINDEENAEYKIYRSKEKYSGYINIASVNGNIYYDTLAEKNIVYYYQVVKISLSGYESYYNSNPKQMLLTGSEPPTSDITYKENNGYITFTLLPNSNEFDGWFIYKKYKNGELKKIFVHSPQVIYNDFDIEEGELTFYARVVKNSIEGALSKVYKINVGQIQYKGDFVVSANKWSLSSGVPLIISTAPNKTYNSASFYLYDMDGRRIMEFEKTSKTVWSGNIRRGRNIKPGVYIIAMIADGKKYFKRIVIVD